MTQTASKAAQAFPLAWPAGVERTKTRRNSAFTDKSLAVTYRFLKEELGRLQASYVVISTNVPLKANGEPYSDPGRMPDPGVAVYFQLNGQPYCMPCDKWLTVEENVWAIGKHVEALRGMQRWGVGSVAQTFAGFKALPESTSPPAEDWAEVLGLQRELTTVDDIQAKYKALALAAHPDRGGSEEAMSRLNVARDRALAEVR